MGLSSLHFTWSNRFWSKKDIRQILSAIKNPRAEKIVNHIYDIISNNWPQLLIKKTLSSHPVLEFFSGCIIKNLALTSSFDALAINLAFWASDTKVGTSSRKPSNSDGDDD